MVLVCGYGCVLDESYRLYLNRIAGFLNIDKPCYIVFSGGPTQQKSAPGKTEAGVMCEYVKTLCPELDKLGWITDTDAFTSLDSIKYLQKALELYDIGNVVVFCDSSRALKVKLMAHKYLSEYNVTVETFDKQSNPHGQLVSTVIEAAMTYFGPLHMPWRWLRQWKSKRR